MSLACNFFSGWEEADAVVDSHDINYMVAYPLIFGELTSES